MRFHYYERIFFFHSLFFFECHSEPFFRGWSEIFLWKNHGFNLIVKHINGFLKFSFSLSPLLLLCHPRSTSSSASLSFTLSCFMSFFEGSLIASLSAILSWCFLNSTLLQQQILRLHPAFNLLTHSSISRSFFHSTYDSLALTVVSNNFLQKLQTSLYSFSLNQRAAEGSGSDECDRKTLISSQPTYFTITQ